MSPFDAVDSGSATECFGDLGTAFAFTAHFFNHFIGAPPEMAFFVKFSPFLSNNIPRHDTQDVFYLNRLILDDQHQSFDDMGQLPYITGPGLILQKLPDIGIKSVGFMVADVQHL